MTAAVLRTVHLYGHLADGIPSPLRLAFNTPAEAVRLIELNFPGFVNKLRQGWYHVVVHSAGQERHLAEYGLGLGFTGDLTFQPAMDGGASGKKKGIMGALIGTAIIGAAFFVSGGALATALPGVLGSVGGLTFSSVAQFGLGLAINGAASLLSATPKTDYGDVDERRSFVFNGPINLSQPGGVVPVVMGRMLVGTYTVSSALDIELVAANEQDKVRSTFVLQSVGATVSIDLDDLVRITQGTQLTSFARRDLGPGETHVYDFGDLRIRVDTPALDVVSTEGKALGEDMIQIKHVDTVNPLDLNQRLVVPYKFLYEGEETNSSVVINLGFPVSNPGTFASRTPKRRTTV